MLKVLPNETIISITNLLFHIGTSSKKKKCFHTFCKRLNLNFILCMFKVFFAWLFHGCIDLGPVNCSKGV